MKQNLISIIIPVYNTKEYLPRCLDSIINQTYENLELLIIDDGSNDGSGDVCDEYAKRDSRIRVIHKENAGQAIARNIGLKISNGSYIGFVDSDDWIEPTMYSELLQALLLNNADIVVCGRNNVNEDYEIINQLFVYDDEFGMTQEEAIRRFLTYDGIDGASCDKLFRRGVLDGITYPTELICEDLPFIYDSIMNSTKIFHIGKPLYNYYQRSGSTSHSKYSKKSYGLVLYTQKINEDVILHYPTLKEEADYYYLFGVYNYLMLLEDAGVNWKTNMEHSFKMTSVLSNRYFTNRKKLKFLLLYFHLYNMVKNLFGED